MLEKQQHIVNKGSHSEEYALLAVNIYSLGRTNIKEVRTTDTYAWYKKFSNAFGKIWRNSKVGAFRKVWPDYVIVSSPTFSRGSLKVDTVIWTKKWHFPKVTK